MHYFETVNSLDYERLSNNGQWYM